MGSNQSKNKSTYRYSNNKHFDKSLSTTNLNRPSSPVISVKPKKNFPNHNLNEGYINPNHEFNNRKNSSNIDSSKSSISSNTHSTPSPKMPLRQNFQTKPRRLFNDNLMQTDKKNPIQNNSNIYKKNPILDLNKQMRNNQQKLSKIIKQSDDQPSYHLSSKLYKPNSLIAAKQNQLPNSPRTQTHVQTLPTKNRMLNKQQQNSVNLNSTNPDKKKFCKSSDNLNHYNNYNKNSSKSNESLNKIPRRLHTTHYANMEKIPVTSKIKRKIFETISNKVSSTNLNKATSNSIFSQSRLMHALQSQWNLFSSVRLSKYEREIYQNQHHRGIHQNRTDTTATFISTSLERNSFRYASRRKYKTQSLANPYRHADTNYPVYIHEALFMPEFSVKGEVTEADFEILDVISRGAFGHVIKVKNKQTSGDEVSVVDDEQIYAMKIMWKSQVIRDRALQQVKDEVTIAINCVDNPLIVKTWHYWQSKRFLYIITDFVENGELLSLWLKVHHFPERLTVIYAVEMSLVLNYLHRHGIIYRDIKMENILLDHRGHIQLIDFGLSKWMKMGERTGTICGTIQYMAPEILSVEQYDHSVDWWSLGILIYAMLLGEYPLNAAKDHIQMNEKVSKHIFELDQSRGDFSEGACDLVRKLLCKDPQRRLTSLNSIKKEDFFQKEIENFVDKALENEKFHSSSKNNDFNNNLNEKEKRATISENFWNPYVIMENYAPLQMLFDEIYTLKQKQQNQSKLNVKTNNIEKLPQVSAPPPISPLRTQANKDMISNSEPVQNHAFVDDSSTSTLSSDKSDNCNLQYNSSYSEINNKKEEEI